MNLWVIKEQNGSSGKLREMEEVQVTCDSILIVYTVSYFRADKKSQADAVALGHKNSWRSTNSP